MSDVASVFSSRKQAYLHGSLFVASLAVYFAGLFFIAPSAGEGAEVLVLFPVVMSAFIWNWKGGLGASFVLVPLNILLIETLAENASSAGFAELPRHLLIVIAGVGAGIIAQLREQLNQTSVQRKEAQQSLEAEYQLRGQLAEISRSLSETRTLDDLVASLNLSLNGVAEFDHLLMGIRKSTVDDLKISHSIGKHSADLPLDTKLPRISCDVSIISSAVGDLNPEDFQEVSLLSAEFQRSGLQSWVITPLHSRHRQVGLLIIASENPEVYESRIAQVLNGIGAQIAPVLDNAITIEIERVLFHRMETQNWDLLQAKAELQATANELQAKNEALEEASEARTAFLSMISHELRTPLTIMNGFAEYLTINSEKNLTDAQLQYVGVMQKNGMQLSRLVDDLLDVARLESGRFELEIGEVNAIAHAREVLRGFKTIASAKQQTLNINIPDEVAWVSADRARLTQVITNLLSNASKYSAEGTDIDLTVSADDEKFTCSVRDHGIGMSDDALNNIFHQFYRAPELKSQNIPGTGLGLVIARSIIDQHGGEISVESTPDEGSEFTFWLPLSTAEPWANSASEPATHEAA
ncbi:MAG: HAMP domain-containing histidine kinase [Chloroflexi bacterium]|nr:HAMP domain-containing histidine kinase [Chloroflexota bacterium]